MDKFNKEDLIALNNVNMKLQAELKQLEGNKDVVSKIKYDEAIARAEKSNDYSDGLYNTLKKKNQTESELLNRIDIYKEEIRELKFECEELKKVATKNTKSKKKHFKTDKESVIDNSSTVEELEQLKHKLSRKGIKWKRNEGKYAEVIRLKAEGKTFKEITATTGISSATITKILKNRKIEI